MITFGCSKASAVAAAAAAQGDDDNNIQQQQQQQQETFVVGGYLPDYRFSADNEKLVDAAAPYLTDLILFSVQPTALDDGANECCLQPSHYEIGRQSKSVQGSSIEKVWLTIGGGGGRSNDIPKILQDPIQTTNFIQSIANLA